MSGDFDDSHPARKIDPDELIKVLAERNEDVPAVTRTSVAPSFPQAEPQTVSDNLDKLASADRICMFNNGNTKLYWVPREEEDGGVVKYSDLIDDSIDWDEIDVTEVPTDKAEEIASKRLKFYRPRSFWTMVGNFTLHAVIVAFGLWILGIGGIVTDTYGISQSLSAFLLLAGTALALVSLIIYVASSGLEYLAAKGYVTNDPIATLKEAFES